MTYVIVFKYQTIIIIFFCGEREPSYQLPIASNNDNKAYIASNNDYKMYIASKNDLKTYNSS